MVVLGTVALDTTEKFGLEEALLGTLLTNLAELVQVLQVQVDLLDFELDLADFALKLLDALVIVLDQKDDVLDELSNFSDLSGATLGLDCDLVVTANKLCLEVDDFLQVRVHELLELVEKLVELVNTLEVAADELINLNGDITTVWTFLGRCEWTWTTGLQVWSFHGPEGVNIETWWAAHFESIVAVVLALRLLGTGFSDTITTATKTLWCRLGHALFDAFVEAAVNILAAVLSGLATVTASSFSALNKFRLSINFVS